MCKSMKPYEKLSETDKRSYSTSHSSSLWFIGTIDGAMYVEQFLPSSYQHKLFRQIEAINLNPANPSSSYKYTIEILQGVTYVIIRKDLACSYFRMFTSFSHMANHLGIPIEAADLIVFTEDPKEYLRMKAVQDMADEAQENVRRLTQEYNLA